MIGQCTVLVCGDAARGDDGAAAAAMALIAPGGLTSARIRYVGQLDPVDLVEALADGRCVVVDAVRGIDAGFVIELPLRRLAAPGGPQPASSHSLPVETVVGLAEALGADLDRGAFVGIGGSRFDLGTGLSDAVEDGLTDAAAAIHHTIHEGEVR